jgi:hypothetical protein
LISEITNQAKMTMEKDKFPVKWITDQIAMGYAPHSYADLDELKSNGIGAVLNLCAECYDLHEIESSVGLEVHWLPVPDEDAPEMNSAIKAIDWMASILAKGENVFVYCRYGIGRTGTMVTAWLIKQGYPLDEALRMLRHTPAEPKSRRQWDFLDAYSRSLGQSHIPKPIDIDERRSRLGRFFRKHLLMDDWRVL